MPGVDKTFVIGKDPTEDPGGKNPLQVQTDGVNFSAAWANDDLVDCPRLKTNDVYAMLLSFGVEAARSTLVAEVSGVFAVYGIGVDSRHLSLIGDYMAGGAGSSTCYQACVCLSVCVCILNQSKLISNQPNHLDRKTGF